MTTNVTMSQMDADLMPEATELAPETTTENREPGRSASQPPGRHIQRPDGITLLAGYHFLIGGLLLLATCGIAIPTVITGIVGFVDDPVAFIGTFVLGVIGAIVLLLCLLNLSVGYGLWTQRHWARTAAMALGVVSLFAVPIGTAIGGLTIWYLMKPEVSLAFE